MNTYLVGGAVRDALLGLPVKERDWVVVGATPEALIAAGYTPVGKDFPVFLHPTTHEEYALARTERKTGVGYHGFATHFATDVTLEQDLLRRDLTINAIAQDPTTGTLIDPYHGLQDLQARCLRHISPAFAEDPLRVLRVARFAARLAPLGFSVATETLTLMRHMAASGELNALTPERIWRELHQALCASQPQQFLNVLRSCGALKIILPEIDVLFGVPQPERWHPEIDTGQHVLLVMEQVAQLSDDPVVRFAALMHDVGKGTTPATQWPHHYGHEMRGAEAVQQICARLRVPNEHRDVALLTTRYHGAVHRALELRPGTLMKLLERFDAFRRPTRLQQCLLACEADHRGRAGLATQPYPQAIYLQQAYECVAAIRPDPSTIENLSGAAIAAQLRQTRITALTAMKRIAVAKM